MVEHQDVSKYIIISPLKSHPIECSGCLVRLNNMIEKSSVDKEPSNMAVLGRYD